MDHAMHAPTRPPRLVPRLRCSGPLAATLAVALAAACLADAPAALAQAGSEGGSIGGSIGGSTGGSIGGNIGQSKPAPPAAHPVQRVQRPAVVQRAPRVEHAPRTARGGGGYGAFDGVWTIQTSSACAGSSTSALRISGSRLYGSGVSGTVSPSGTIRAVGRYSGLTHYSSGQLSGSSGGGSYRRADGCTGSWSAYRSS